MSLQGNVYFKIVYTHYHAEEFFTEWKIHLGSYSLWTEQNSLYF